MALMKQHAAQLETETLHANGEVPFSFEELFFSRTNEKGHILSGNSVFQRVSMYAWDELLHKPHNVIRHPDMPRAVFWLLWDTIKKGQPIGAYVKNKAKDGRYYWVFAIVTPIEGGYLSVRLKPSAPIFAVVEQAYMALVATERDRRMKPAESAHLLLETLAQLGFRDYGAFAATALSQEITARDGQLGRTLDSTAGYFDQLSQASQSLLTQAATIFEAYAKNKYVPMNLRVQAAQLGEAGATIGVISGNYSIISDEIKTMMNEFIASSEQVVKTVNNGLFLICTARIQREVLELFHQETTFDATSRDQEISYLERQQNTYRQSAVDGLHAIATQAERFHQSCVEMKRLTAGLEVTRIMGKIESSRLIVSNDSLNQLIDDLEGFQISIANSLKEIENANQCIERNIQQLMRGSVASI
jgi:aerotaxis receptor